MAAPDSAEKLEKLADEVIILDKPSFFAAVGQFYEVFSQVSDEEAKQYLDMANRHGSVIRQQSVKGAS